MIEVLKKIFSGWQKYPPFEERTAWVCQYQGGSMSSIISFTEEDVARLKKIDALNDVPPQCRYIKVRLTEI